MSPNDLIEVMRAARKLGAVSLRVRDGAVTVDFADAKPAQRRARRQKTQPVEDIPPSVVPKQPKLSIEQIEQLYEDVLAQYEPGN